MTDIAFIKCVLTSEQAVGKALVCSKVHIHIGSIERTN